MYVASIILQSLVLGTQILLVAVSLYLVFSSSRIIYLTVGAIGAAAAYVLYWGILVGWPIQMAILLALGAAILLGLVSTELLEPFAVRGEPLLGLLVGLASAILLESVIAIFFGTDGKSLETGVLSVVNLWGVDLDVPGVATIGFGLFLALLSWFLVQFTGVGRLLRSVAENSALTTSLGVNNRTVRRVAYVLSALVAALIVILTGWHTALTPLMGFQLVVAAYIALLMGGVNDLRGTIVSSYAIAIIPGLIIGFTDGFSENWRLVFVFLIAIVVLAIRPNGLFSRSVRTA